MPNLKKCVQSTLLVNFFATIFSKEGKAYTDCVWILVLNLCQSKICKELERKGENYRCSFDISVGQIQKLKPN